MCMKKCMPVMCYYPILCSVHGYVLNAEHKGEIPVTFRKQVCHMMTWFNILRKKEECNVKLPSSESILKTVQAVSQIALGTNKDGTPRSLFDAKMQMEKQGAKLAKKRSKRARKALRHTGWI